MTEQELNVSVRLSCQIALLGTITPNVRMITIGWDGLKLFHLRAYFSESPSDDEIEEMEAVCTEVVADFPFEKDKVECLRDTRMRRDLEILKHMVYARKE